MPYVLIISPLLLSLLGMSSYSSKSGSLGLSLGPRRGGGGGDTFGGDTSRYYTKPQKTIQRADRPYKALKIFAKPRQTLPRPDRLYKVPKRLYKDAKY